MYTHTYTQIAGVNYGGHVTDDWDRRVLYTYIGDMFLDEALNTPYYRRVYLPPRSLSNTACVCVIRFGT